MTRPTPDEFAPFYQTYVGALPEDADVLQVLAQQHKQTLSLISTLDEDRALFRYAPAKWSIKQVIGHMIDTERVLSYRAMCFARCEAAALPGMDENDFVRFAHFDDRPLASLQDEQDHLRSANLAMFRSFSEEVLQRRGTASDCEFTVRALIWITAGHERHHLNVLQERYFSHPGFQTNP